MSGTNVYMAREDLIEMFVEKYRRVLTKMSTHRLAKKFGMTKVPMNVPDEAMIHIGRHRFYAICKKVEGAK